MNTNAEKEILDQAASELVVDQESKQSDESKLSSDTTKNTTSDSDESTWWVDSSGEQTSEPAPLDNSLFEDKVEKKSQVSEEDKTLDRERVRQATIDRWIQNTVWEDWSLDIDKMKELPEWVQKEINLQFSKPAQEAQKYLTREDVYRLRQEDKDNEEFEALKQEIVVNWKLSQSLQKELSEEYQELRATGMWKFPSLKKAAKIAWLYSREAIEKAKQIWFQRWVQKFPTWSVSSPREVPLENKDIKEMSNEEVISMMQAA